MATLKLPVGNFARLKARLLADRQRLNAISKGVATAAQIAMLAGLALIIGIMTSRHFIVQGTPFNTEGRGAWVRWPTAGTPQADPYTLARFLGQGSLIVNGERVQRWEAHTDDTGARLSASCEYALEGRSLDRHWWSINVFDPQGRLLTNSAGRYGVSSSSLLQRPDGSFVIRMAREARPDNWLPTGPGGRLVLIFEAHGERGEDGTFPDVQVPSIRKVAC